MTRRIDPVLTVDAGTAVGAAAAPQTVTLSELGDVTPFASEDVLLLAVTLPAMSAAQRRVATRFAVEDDLAQPLDQVHVVPGPQLPDGRWLVAIVDRDRLTGIAVPRGRRLWPDVLLLPVPPDGWAVLGQPDRVLVRLPDGTGFAIDPAGALAVWTLAGSPPVHACGGPLPAGMVVSHAIGLPAAPDPALAGFDLLAGMRQTGGMRLPRSARLTLNVAAVFLLGHLSIAVADTVALSRLQAAREGEVRAALAAAGQTAGPDLTASLSQALATTGTASDGGFLGLATQVFGALADDTGQVSLTELRYAQGALVMTVEASDLTTLQQIETNLRDAGLPVQAGVATTRDGAAQVQMTVASGAT